MAVKEKIDELKTTASERTNEWVDEHPNATIWIAYGIGLLVAVPLGVWYCHAMGKAQGKGLAQGFLKEAGVQLGYSHD